MKDKRKTYMDRLNEQTGKLAAQLALLQTAGTGLIMAEADIEYYKTIEAYMAAERRCAHE